MIELAHVDRLPIDEVVAGSAILAQPPLVLILVASHARRGKAQIGSAGIFDLDRGAFLGRNVRGIMALRTLQPSVLALENVPGIFVIEGFDIPLDQGKIFTVVLGMTAGAFLAGTARNVVGRVQALVSGEAGSDFSVTVQAFEGSLTAEFMATGAIGRTVEGLVGPRQRARRNLRPSTRTGPRQKQCEKRGKHRSRGGSTEARDAIAPILARPQIRSHFQSRLTPQYLLASSEVRTPLIVALEFICQ